MARPSVHSRIREQGFHRAHAASEAAAEMRDEDDDGLAGEVVVFKEGVHGHRDIAPPDRHDDEDGVALRERLRRADDLRAGVLLLLIEGELRERVVFAGVVLRGLDEILLPADLGLNHVRDRLGIAAPRIGQDARGGRGVHVAVFRDLKADRENISRRRRVRGRGLRFRGAVFLRRGSRSAAAAGGEAEQEQQGQKERDDAFHGIPPWVC